jgi:hypothetical protein
MVERETGIEPALVAWKATVLPLNYSRTGKLALPPQQLVRPLSKTGGGRWIRTTEGVSQQIYSLPPLAAWVSLQLFDESASALKEPVIVQGTLLHVNG